MNPELKKYQASVLAKLNNISPFLLKYALGDFSEKISVPEEEDEFAELLVGINLMVDDLQEILLEKEDTISRLKQLEDSLRESERKYRILFDTMPTAWAFHQVVVDENNKPIDYIYLEVNAAFERFTGLSAEMAVGKKVTEVIPGIENGDPDLITIFGTVALTGKEDALELYFEPFEKWYRVKLSSPEIGFFVAVFDDITIKKNSENELLEYNKELELFRQIAVGREHQMIELKKEINALSIELEREAPYDVSFAE